MKLYKSPIEGSNFATVFRAKGKILQIDLYEKRQEKKVFIDSEMIDFSDYTDGVVVSVKSGLPLNVFVDAKIREGELYVTVLNPIDASAAQEERFPSWSDTVDEPLDASSKAVVMLKSQAQIDAEKEAQPPSAEKILMQSVAQLRMEAFQRDTLINSLAQTLAQERVERLRLGNTEPMA